jgi:hypothetical protein
MKRIAVIIAVALGLTGTALAGPAGASTTIPQNPAPHCVPFTIPECTCPHGWHVDYNWLWLYWSTCKRNS